MQGMRPHVVEVVEAPDSPRVTIAQTETYVADLEPEHYRWAWSLGIFIFSTIALLATRGSSIGPAH